MRWRKRAISCSSPRMDRLSVPPQRNTASAARALRRSTSRATMKLVGMVQVDPEDKDEISAPITQLGMALRFKLDTVSCTGRATAGVRGIDVGRRTTRCAGLKSRRRAICCLYSAIAVSASGCSATTWNVRAVRARGKSFCRMNKTGETGTQVAVCLNVTGAKSVRVEQKHGHTVLLNMDEIAVERRASKGQLLVNVLLDECQYSMAH